MTEFDNSSFDATTVIDDGDMLLRRALPHALVDAIGPFVFIDHYRHWSRRGIGDRPHPHAGIEVISYMLEGEVHHRDSMGFSDVIRAGDVQVICAGRGMIHEERPSGGRHGLQMWTSLPAGMKQTTPTYRRYSSTDLAFVCDAHGTLRVICGRVNGLSGSVQLARRTLLAHAALPKGGTRSLVFDADQEAAIYTLDGEVTLDGQSLRAGAIRRVDPSRSVVVQACTACNVLVFGGVPAEEQILFSGPFVMDTEEGLRQAHQDYLSGSMGTLNGVPF